MPDSEKSDGGGHLYCGGKNLIEDNQQSSAADITKGHLRKLLALDNVGFLMGSGTSIDAGAPTMSDLSKTILPLITNECFSEDENFWPAVLKSAWEGKKAFTMPDKDDKLSYADINIEKVAAHLICAAALSELQANRSYLRFGGMQKNTQLTKSNIKKAISIFRDNVFELCSAPTDNRDFEGRITHHIFLKKCLAFRRQNQRRLHLFATNYDLLVESACDDIGIHYVNGFSGVSHRRFWPEEFDIDFHRVDPGEQPKPHFYDRVVHLVKLHGSIVWTASKDPSDPYDIEERPFQTVAAEQIAGSSLPLLVYPSPNKYGEVLGFPYSELFRRFSGFVARPQTVLFTVGYGFNDEHVNAVIRQGLAHPSFTLVIVHPHFEPDIDDEDKENSYYFDQTVSVNHILEKFAATNDPRIFFIGGKMAYWKNFVIDVMPDVHEEDPFEVIRQTLIQTSQNR
ncbi:MAG: SIR2 family protein [Desulfobacteraceae bacterium]|jgi:hypothetical protein